MIGKAVGMYCIVTTPDGEKITLWNESGYDGEPILQDLPIISAIEMQLRMKMAVQVSVTLDATYEQALALLNSPVVWPRNVMEVWIGYPDLGLYTPRVTGQVLKPEVSFTPEGGTIVLTAKGVEYEMFRRRATRSWKGKSTEEIVREIVVDQYGVKLDVSDDAKARLKEKLNINQKQVTDWELIRRVLEPYDCTMRFGTDSDSKPTLFVVTHEEWQGKPPIKKFVMRGNFDVENQEYPLLQFDTPTDWTWLVSSSKSVLSMDIGVDDKKTKKNEASPETSSVPRPGLYELAGKVGDAIQDAAGRVPEFLEDTVGKVIPMTSRDPAVQGRLQAKNDDAARDAGIKANCRSFGVPDFRPGEMVELVVTHGGEGSILDGNYGVTQISHSASADGWEMSFSGFKGGFGKNVKFKGANEAKDVANEHAQGGESGVEKKAEPL